MSGKPEEIKVPDLSGKETKVPELEKPEEKKVPEVPELTDEEKKKKAEEDEKLKEEKSKKVLELLTNFKGLEDLVAEFNWDKKGVPSKMSANGTKSIWKLISKLDNKYYCIKTYNEFEDWDPVAV